MSRGFGRVQRALMDVLNAGRAVTSFELAAKVYGTIGEPGGEPSVTRAQRSAVRCALASLRRRGLVFQCGRNRMGRAVWTTRQLAEAYADLIPDMLGTRSSVQRWCVAKAMANHALRAKHARGS